MNNFAISSGGIGEALERSASSLMAANNTIDESIALITAANTVVQNPESVGNAFKTISMRIRGAKTELEEAGLETEGMVESTSKLRSEILALTGVDIMDGANQFKSTYAIMDELAAKWKDLTDIQQATVTELIAGKRQGNIVSSLMTNFDTARDALETSMNSAGSAMREHEKWQQSLEAQILKLKASWQGLSQAFLSSDFLHGALDAVIGLVDGITKLMDTFGTLPTLLGTVAAGFSAFKNKGLFKFDKDAKSIQLLGIQLTGLGDKYATVQSKIARYNSLSAESQEKLRVKWANSNTTFGKYISGLKGSKASFTGYIGSLVGATVKTIALEAATIALNAALTMGISFAIQAIITAFDKLIVTSDELAEKVDELISKFEEEHNALIKLKSDYDTANESSMISKYEKLSKGVDSLGRNVSLTADEYSEYQSIVNKIAEQIPSLISGYDSQGNALLSCKGNVEELTAAYEKLIHSQNQAILTNTSDIEKDFANTLKDKNGETLWGKFREWNTNLPDWANVLVNLFSPGVEAIANTVDGIADLTVGNKITTDTAKTLKDLLNTDHSKLGSAIAGLDKQTMSEVKTALKDAGIDVSFWSDGSKELEETIKNDSAKIKGIVDNYYASFAEAIDEQKTIIQAKLSEAFDVSSAISGLNYGNINEELQTIAYQTMNSLDLDFFEKLSKSGKTTEQWTDELLKQLNNVGKAYGDEIENVFELQGKFNSGEVAYGEYVKELQEFDKLLDSLNLKSEAKEQLKISVGLDEGGIVEQYNQLVNRLTDTKNYDFAITKKEAEAWLNSLSSEDLALAVEIITETSNNGVNETIAQLQAMLDKEKAILGLSLELNIEDEKAKLEALAAAMSESVSGSGLSTESLSAIESIFGDISGYDPAKLFERTANGIRLNTEEFRKLNSEYKKSNIDDINKEMDTLGDAYIQTREELSNLTYGTDEYNDKARELDAIKNQINEVEKLASGYEGLASAYQEWQMVESAGSQRDMYEGIIEGFENIDDEISRGWLDDGTIEFLELLTGRTDLAYKSGKELKEIYDNLDKNIGKSGYSIRDFFTVNEDGDSTNTGVYNFLETVETFEDELGNVIKRENGNIIGFDFKIAGGDKAIADALGISEELVQIMVRAADDAGFVVSMDGTYQQLDVLVQKAQEAADKLKNTFKATNYDFFQDGSDEGIVKDYQEALKLWETFKKNKNADGTVNMNVKGAQEAFTLVSTLQSMVDQLNEPVYMELNASDVEKEMQTPLSKLQEYERLTQTEHQLQLKGTDTSTIEADKEKILDYFEELSPEIKANLGIKNDSRAELEKKLEDGKIEIPATVDLQVEMNQTLKDMVNVALYNAGIIEKDELEKRVNVNIYAEEVDTSDVEDKTKEAVKDAIEEKGEETVAVETQVDLEATINEAADLIQKFEDKDITINVKVKGVDQVKNLNKQIDLATDIDGNVGKLSEYVESAKALSELDDNITSFVTAEVKGNVLDKSKKELKRLGEFAEHAKTLQDANSKQVDISANINGNVLDTKEKKIDNLKVFVDSAKGIEDIKGDIVSNITANTLGSVFENKNEDKYIDNLKTYIESAKGIKDIEGDIVSNITANTLGSVFEDKEKVIDNLDVFVDSAQGIKDIEGNIVSNITANTLGDVFEDKERNIDNLKTFIDSAKGIKDIEGNIVSNITANTLGSVFEDKERSIDNIKTFIDSAKGIKDIEGNIVSNITANTLGSVFEDTERTIDNLDVFIDSAKGIKDIEGNIVSNITANTLGSVFNTKEKNIDNLKTFIDSAKGLKDIDSKTVNITANTLGDVFEEKERSIDNLYVFAEGAKALQNVNSKTVNITANTLGDVFEEKEKEIDNLKVFADGAKALQGASSKTVNITANVDGNAIAGEGASSRLSSLTEFQSLVEGMSSQTVTVSVSAKVDSEKINSAIDLLTKVANSGVFKDYNATVQVGAKIATIDDATVKNYQAPPKDGKVKYSVDPESSVYTWTAPSKDGVVNYSASVEALTDSQKHKTGTITYKAKVEGGGVVNGTANANGSAFANGTSGRAFARGNWRTKKTETALTGELGREIVVTPDNHWYTVGDSGAEFATIPKGSIVFNHKQTEELFANGKVTSGGGRGKAFVEGTAFSRGTGGIGKITEVAADGTRGKTYTTTTKTTTKKTPKATTTTTTTTTSNDSNSYNRSGSNTSGGGIDKVEGSAAGSQDKFEETFDWISIAIERIEREIDNLDKTVNNTYKSWSDRNTALNKEITKVGEEITLQNNAATKYLAQANAVGLDEKWAKKVREGTLDISTITNEDTAEKIKEYQKWYELFLKCIDAVAELKETEAELYAQRFENVQAQYDGILQGYEHTEAMLEEYINQAEAKGHIVSKKYYEALIANEKNNINVLKQEQAALIAARDKAVINGIDKNSQDWYDMCSEIDGVTQAIEEGNTALIEYANSIRDIDWQVFDLIQERISDVNAEADFLIDLMSSDKLFDDNGKLTDKGMATMGLHGQNYNTYMYAADEYGKEISKLDSQIAKDPYDQELVNRRRELVELQRESILAAEDEKSAIRDMVEEGISLELDALQELIDKKNEALESERDLYEYQKKVKEQTSEIASLEKQIAAYSGDNSEEARAKIQELKVSLDEAKTNLEETEYDKYLSDTQQMLDTLYEEYELVLNERLDNVDALLTDMITEINASATTISSTLSAEATNVGATLSEAMKGIWENDGVAKSVIAEYGAGFQSKQTTTNLTLDTIKGDVDRMVDDVDKDATTKVNSNKTTTSAKKNPTTTSSTKKTTTTTNTSSTGDGTPKIGDKVKFLSGKYYYDSQGVNPAGSKNHGKYVYITNVNDKQWATHPIHISTGKKLGSGDLGWLKKNQISGYATGKKNFLNNEIAWTQENGQEFIVRPSDGAILTPIAKGDSVLNAQASGNIWDIANSPAEFIKDNLNLDTANVPNGSSVQNNTVQNFDKIVFSMPNVKNYSELLSEFQRDPKFDKLIKAMTIEQIAGKTSLAKNKSIR